LSPGETTQRKNCNDADRHAATTGHESAPLHNLHKTMTASARVSAIAFIVVRACLIQPEL
jgi:hypothetical protein